MKILILILNLHSDSDSGVNYEGLGKNSVLDLINVTNILQVRTTKCPRVRVRACVCKYC